MYIHKICISIHICCYSYVANTFFMNPNPTFMNERICSFVFLYLVIESPESLSICVYSRKLSSNIIWYATIESLLDIFKAKSIIIYHDETCNAVVNLVLQ